MLGRRNARLERNGADVGQQRLSPDFHHDHEVSRT
jgi:hypothetical protein